MNLNRFTVVTEHKPVAPYRYRYAPRRVPTIEQMIRDQEQAEKAKKQKDKL